MPHISSDVESGILDAVIPKSKVGVTSRRLDKPLLFTLKLLRHCNKAGGKNISLPAFKMASFRLCLKDSAHSCVDDWDFEDESFISFS